MLLLPDFLFLFSFPCSADPRAGLATVQSSFLGLTINTLNVRNNNNSNNNNSNNNNNNNNNCSPPKYVKMLYGHRRDGSSLLPRQEIGRAYLDEKREWYTCTFFFYFLSFISRTSDF